MKHKNNNISYLFHVHDCDAIDVGFVNEHRDTRPHEYTHAQIEYAQGSVWAKVT